VLRHPPREADDPVLPPPSTPLPTDRAARYRIDGEIARGGMGAVFKGRDPDLGREIAVKVLLETHQGKTELVQRFVEEAQIAGQLQHPGITPVYELGQFADKRPYFTMKLIKARTLAALLAARKEPAEDRARYIGIFGQVCQTLAYAHARGVIHRDLKPANIMVGSFGEVQVMDWGLAKVLKEGGVADEQKALTQQTVSMIRTQRNAGTPEVGSDTQAGSVLGTPAYMAPEQARGDVDLVDARADVFGLGAILCEILTGQPPFTGKKAEALRKAQSAQLEDALSRLEGCSADAEIIHLARRCLAAKPWHRPRDAEEVADAVTAYQDSVAERLRQAELAHAAEVARTEEAQATAAQERKAKEAAQAQAAAERQARHLTLGLAVSVLALVTVGAVSAIWMQQQRAARVGEAQRQREAVETALDKAREMGSRARWAEARAVLEQTRDRLRDSGPEDLRRRVEQAMVDLTLVDRLDAIRLKRSTWIEGKFDDRGAEAAYAATFRDAGLGEEGEDPEKVAALIRESSVREHLVAALDDWAVVARDRQHRTWVLEVARRADPDPWRDRFRNPQVWRDPAGLEALAKELLADEQLLARQKPQLLAALGVVLVARQADAAPLLAASQARFPDDFWLNFDLAGVLREKKRWDEAIGFYRGAVALRPSAVAVHNDLGTALARKQQLDAAIQEFRRAIELDSRFARGLCNLGTALHGKQELEAALQEFHRAIELDPKDATPHFGLGNVLAHKQQLDAAIQEYHTAISLDPRFAEAHHGLGHALHAKQQLAAAIQEYRKAIELDLKFAPLHHDLGNALLAKQHLDEAIQEYRRAIVLDPKFPEVHGNLGNALRAKHQLDAAIQEYRKAIELDPKDARSHTNLGAALYEKKHLDAAIQEFRRAIELDPKLAMPHNNLGSVLYGKQQVEEAIQEYRRAIELDPNLALPHCNLGKALRDKQQLDAAIQEYRRAIALDPKYAEAHDGLGNGLYSKQQVDAAIQEYRKAIQIDPAYANAHYNLGNALYDRQQLDEAIREFRRAIALDPTKPLAHYNLGRGLYAKQQLGAAIEEFRRAIELDPKDPLPHHYLGLALNDKQQPDAAIQEFRRAIALDPKLAVPHYNLGHSLHGRQQLEEAIQEYRRAIDLDPKLAEAHCNLGGALRQVGLLVEALAEYRAGHRVGSAQPGWRYPSAQWVKEAESLVELDRKVAAVVEGKEKLANDAQRLACARFCQQPYKKLHAMSVRLYAEAFAQDAKLADDVPSGNRYNAACSAALAGCGQGKDAGQLDEKERARLRKQAAVWLRADLVYWTRQVQSAKPRDRELAQKMLRHWQDDSDLNGLRDPAPLKKLPADEREACKKLWADVANLLK
jgi:serine/threonine-protein kinase